MVRMVSLPGLRMPLSPGSGLMANDFDPNHHQPPAWYVEYTDQYHPKACQCERCQQERMQRRQGKPAVNGLLWFSGTVVFLFVAWFMLHTWYVDTHCAMVLGTQVCQ